MHMRHHNHTRSQSPPLPVAVTWSGTRMVGEINPEQCQSAVVVVCCCCCFVCFFLLPSWSGCCEERSSLWSLPLISFFTPFSPSLTYFKTLLQSPLWIRSGGIALLKRRSNRKERQKLNLDPRQGERENDAEPLYSCYCCVTVYTSNK